MSAPRIKVRVDAAHGLPPIIWYCDHGPTLRLCAGGETYTIAAAADAGREHMRQAHPEVVWAAGGSVYQSTYCREHGVALTDCEPYHDRTTSVAQAWDDALEDAWQSGYDRNQFAPNPWRRP